VARMGRGSQPDLLLRPSRPCARRLAPISGSRLEEEKRSQQIAKGVRAGIAPEAQAGILTVQVSRGFRVPPSAACRISRLRRPSGGAAD